MLPAQHLYRETLANQIVGDVGFCRNDRLAIEVIKNGVDDPVEQVQGSRVSKGGIAMQVMAIEQGIANPGQGSARVAPEVLAVGVAD